MAKRNPVSPAADTHANANQGTPPAAAVPTQTEVTVVDDSLTPVQRQAIESLARGSSFKSAAADAGIDRKTLYRWLHDDHSFRAAYYTWKAEIQESARARLLSLADAAVDAMGHAVHQRDARVAQALLKGLSILSPNAPGPEDPLESQRLSELERVAREAEFMERENQVWQRRSDANDWVKRLFVPKKEPSHEKPLSEKKAVDLIQQIQEGEKEDAEEGL